MQATNNKGESMTPTDAARTVIHTHEAGYRGMYDHDHMISIACALLAAQARITDITAEVERLRAENESLRQLAQAITNNKLDGIWAADIHINNRFVNWFDRRRELLATPTENSK